MKITLKDILVKVSANIVQGDRNTLIEGITQDSREVKPGFIYIAIKGYASDGHKFIEGAINSGAIAIVCEQLPKSISSDPALIHVDDSRKTLAIMAANFYGNPSSKLAMVGFTGTN